MGGRKGTPGQGGAKFSSGPVTLGEKRLVEEEITASKNQGI